jgi:glutamine cyclotransferase
MKLVTPFLLVSIITSCVTNTANCASSPTLAWNLERTLPHDSSHFTQGLEIDGDRIFESAGRYGFSAVYEKARDTGAILRKHALDRRWFAEGLTLWNDELIVLTWREQIAQVFDKLLRPIRRLRYSGEGWGLTHDRDHLIMSDGSAALTFRDPYSFTITRRIQVTDDGESITQLNELEYVDGRIFANVWKSNRIAVIDPSDGSVHAWLDLSSLHDALPRGPFWDEAEFVLNGIAYDHDSRQLYVTGKCWPQMFVLSIDPMPVLAGPATSRQ